MTPPCPYRQADQVCVADHIKTVHHTMVLALDPMPQLRWCQHCGGDIGGQGRRVCAMCEADIREREEHSQ